LASDRLPFFNARLTPVTIHTLNQALRSKARAILQVKTNPVGIADTDLSHKMIVTVIKIAEHRSTKRADQFFLQQLNLV